MRRLMQITLALLIAWTISAQPSMAQGKGHAFGKNKDRAQIGVRVRSDDRVFVRQPRRTVFDVFNANSGRPPGWDRGRKVGWGNCDLPPGQAKKYGCSGFVFRDRFRDFDRFGDRDRFFRDDDRFRENDRLRGRGIVVVPIR
jgi:hypothetical protein